MGSVFNPPGCIITHMKELKQLFENNRAWAEGRLKQNPNYFSQHLTGQSPKYLWIGCSDSRIPANEILGLEPGEVFVHRNVANLFPHTDFNCLSVLQYGLDYLGIDQVIVCGHYQCGGVAASMENAQFGLVDNWLRNIRDVYAREKEELDGIEDKNLRYRRLIELNVLHQVMNVCHTTIVQNTWAKGKKLSIHGWVYDLSTGLLKDLNCCISSMDQIDSAYQTLQLH
jgi:carbonic anhydrase